MTKFENFILLDDFNQMHAVPAGAWCCYDDRLNDDVGMSGRGVAWR